MKIVARLKKHSFFVLVFTIVKATVYFVPLLLADVLSRTDFGILEYALAGLGMVVNTVINLGVPGAYPYFILKEKRLDLQSSFKLHSIVLLIPFAVNQVLFFFFQLEINFYLAFNVSYIIANQIFYSTQFKSHQKSTFAVVLDSGVYIVLLGFYIFYILGIIELSIKEINKVVLYYCFAYIFVAFKNFINHKKTISLTKYKKILKFSIHLLVSTLLIFLITSSGRILAELFFDFETVGIYSFYFRLAAVVVMIYQVVSISFFKDLYILEPLKLDKYYYKFFIFIYALSILIFFVAPYIVGPLSAYFSQTYLIYKNTYFLLSCQMVVWIATALNSNIIDRENLAPKNNIKFVGLLILALSAFYLFKNKLDLQTMVFLHYSVLLLACLIQYYSLSKKKIIFKKSYFTILTLYIVTGCYYFFVLK